MTKHDYREPGSFDRIREAALAYADADTDDDLAFNRADARLRQAVNAYGRRKFERIKRMAGRRVLPSDPRQVAMPWANVRQEPFQTRGD